MTSSNFDIPNAVMEHMACSDVVAGDQSLQGDGTSADAGMSEFQVQVRLTFYE